LGDRLALDSGTLTPLLKRLEALGLLQRLRDAADERRVLLRLTPTGRRLRTSAQKVPVAIARATGCELGQITALTAQLQQLQQRLTDSPPRAA
jgi:DNA-binding MarR family transcriptional regulator